MASINMMSSDYTNVLRRRFKWIRENAILRFIYFSLVNMCSSWSRYVYKNLTLVKGRLLLLINKNYGNGIVFNNYYS